MKYILPIFFIISSITSGHSQSKFYVGGGLQAPEYDYLISESSVSDILNGKTGWHLLGTYAGNISLLSYDAGIGFARNTYQGFDLDGRRNLVIAPVSAGLKISAFTVMVGVMADIPTDNKLEDLLEFGLEDLHLQYLSMAQVRLKGFKLSFRYTSSNSFLGNIIGNDKLAIDNSIQQRLWVTASVSF